MKVSTWLVALLLNVAGNGVSAQAAPAPPAQVAPTQTAEAAPAQPAPLPPATVAPAQAPYVPRPAAPPGTIALPPYPAPPPAVFASASEFADYGIWRLEQLTARERGLLLLGRPEGYVGKRIGGFAMLAGGLAITVISASAVFFATAVPHSGYDEQEDGPRLVRGFGGGACVGIALIIGGAVWLRQLQRDNRYRDEIAALHQERSRLQGDVKRARRQANVERRMSFHLTRLQVKF